MLSNGEGLLMGIINGFGSMANRYIEDEAAVEKQRKLEEIRAQIEEQKMRTQAALELEFAPQKAQVAADIKETARKNEVGIVNEALQKRADNAADNLPDDPKLGYQDVIGARGPLSEEQQAARDQGLEANREKTRQGILASNKERMLATGDAGLKMDPTAVNADNKDDLLAYREAQLAKQTADARARGERDERTSEDRRRAQDALEESRKVNQKLAQDNLNLAKDNGGQKKIDALNSAILREETLIEKIKSNVAVRSLSDIQKNTGTPEKNAAIVEAALEKDPQAQAAMKRAEEMRTRLNKMLEDSAKAPEATPSATPARTNPSGISTPVTQSDYDALPSGASYFKGGKIYKKR